MKTLLKTLVAAILTVGVAVSCYDDSALVEKIEGLEGRVSTLEDQMKTANQNIVNLQTLTQTLNGGKCIVYISEKDGVYTIRLSDGTEIVLRSGKDGAAGSAPVIGVKQDKDGVYYWTLNGEWLLNDKGEKMRVTGEDGVPGEPGAPGEPGEPGAPGEPGNDGADAIAPRLDIRDGYWYISTDGGTTWTKLDKATGEDGDSWFTGVTWDDDYVYLTLADETVLKLRRGEAKILSIAVVPDYNDGSVKAGTGLFTMRFKVEPESAAESLLDLKPKCFKLNAVYTLTKAAGDFTSLPIHEMAVEDGILTITTTGEGLGQEFASKKLGVNAALFISNETFSVNTGYFPLWPKNEYMGHEYVDLGLESGNMWADTDLGAQNPGEPGAFYAWGELEPKDSYSWDNYLWGPENGITKYCELDGKTSFKDYDYEDDVARKAWDGEWRTPTWEDWEELLDNNKFSWVWTTKNGHDGYEVKSKKDGYKDQSIFLAVGGWMDGTILQDPSVGYYWSSTRHKTDYPFAYNLGFYNGSAGQAVWGRRTGLRIRPVLGKYEEKDHEPAIPEAVDLGLSSGVKWADINLGAINPEDIGDYYAWGETKPKDYYSRDTYKWETDGVLSKYCSVDDAHSFDEYGYEDDAARANLGGEWRTPSVDDWKELADPENFTWTWTTRNGVQGYHVKSNKTGAAIFLPAGGYKENDKIVFTQPNLGFDPAVPICIYMSSKRLPDNPVLGNRWAHALVASKSFGKDKIYVYGFGQARYTGIPVRAVLGERPEVSVTGISLDRETITLSVGMMKHLNASVLPQNAGDIALDWTSADESIAAVDKDGNVTGVAIGTTAVTVKTVEGNHTATCTVIVKDESELAANPVDLGLPSGVLWADRNVGATTPEDYGEYYAWGEIDPYYLPGHAQDNPCMDWRTGKEAGYNNMSYRWYENGDNSKRTKYGVEHGKNLDLKDYDYEDDAARQNMGGEWRIPTVEEWEELLNPQYCSKSFETVNGVICLKVTSKMPGYTDKSILLPVAGIREDRELRDVGKKSNYWTSSLFSQPSMGNAYHMNTALGPTMIDTTPRCSYGFSVHAVVDGPRTEDIPVVAVVLSDYEVTLNVGETKQLTATIMPQNATDKNLVWTSGNASVASISSNGLVTALAKGTTTITVSSANGQKSTCKVTVVDPTGAGATPEAIDLGLPSGVKWADINIGASSPSDGGDYFAWGEVEPYYLPGHALDNPCNDWKFGKGNGYDSWSYKWINSSGMLTRYNNSPSLGTVDNFITFADYKYDDDAARANWQGEWRTPTVADFRELMNPDYCQWEQTSVNGVPGYRVRSKISGYTDKSIFLPVVGYRFGTQIEFTDCMGCYWTATAIRSSADARVFEFNIEDGVAPNLNLESGRVYGLAVRPVVGEPAAEDDFVDMGLSVKWGKRNLGADEEWEGGDFYAWGETEPYYLPGYAHEDDALWKEDKGRGYYWPAYRWYVPGLSGLAKYFPDPTGMPFKTVLEPEDDAAAVNLGEGWRMPTIEEFGELLDDKLCKWEKETITNASGYVPGYRVTSLITGNSIFLPAKGVRDALSLLSDWYALYWSSSVCEGEESDYFNAQTLHIFPEESPKQDKAARYYGFYIRPVHD
ncbi:MAG: Ig-like domain-containing protein [Bacteroidales bacterium]|nr:Ig-like domain-containing protein [Bacteroidales bacterium]